MAKFKEMDGLLYNVKYSTSVGSVYDEKYWHDAYIVARSMSTALKIAEDYLTDSIIVSISESAPPLVADIRCLDKTGKNKPFITKIE